jgi:transposase
MREVINAIFYVLRGGIPWRMLPHDFPPWGTVWYYFRLWRLQGIWEAMNAALRERVRVREGREPTPSAGVLDSQSARTTEKGGHMAMTGERK